MNPKPLDFQFKEIDSEGFETLSVISDAVHFNNWTFETLRPWCSGKILEIGSGIGNISGRFIENNYDITLSDIRSNYRDFLALKFPEISRQQKIKSLDLVHPQFEEEYAALLGSFDTVFALNVIEHIENDSLAIANCHKLLKKGGTLIILVPAFQALYNLFDKELFHFKRYRSADLNQLFISNSLIPIKSFYFNAGGIPGWFVSGNLQKNKTIPPSQMRMFDKLVPVFKLLDKILLNKIGLSVICVGKKN
ncbi:MAG: class I SAM-dependent methyltransferase [Bacteroidota bacterium]|nr:class I SAM-dependent methyltransferase [Bacteroidota bacterium]